MKKMLVVLMVLVTSTGCNAQHNKKHTQAPADTLEDKPKVVTKVNKKYDDKGNLVGYDSTYMWSYSNSGNGKHSVYADTVMNEFRQKFDAEFPSMFNSNFGNPVWSDSLFFRDFTDRDYFMQKWDSHYFNMKGMMQKMDSFKNSFLDNTYPGLREETPSHRKASSGSNFINGVIRTK